MDPVAGSRGTARAPDATFLQLLLTSAGIDLGLLARTLVLARGTLLLCSAVLENRSLKARSIDFSSEIASADPSLAASHGNTAERATGALPLGTRLSDECCIEARGEVP